ncbi:MAG: DUF4386 domain-containing protein [Bacteroidota bacterium]
MKTYRSNAIIVGVLYILGTVTGILSVVFTNSVTNDPDFLAAVLANQNQVIVGTLFILAMGISLALIPAVLFPVAKKVNEVLAVGYVVFRGALETVAYLAMVVCWLLIVSLSRGAAAGSIPSSSQNLGVVLQQVNDAIGLILIIAFSLGALMLYSLLYQSKLVPRWISIWGFIAILMHLSTSFLGMFGLVSTSLSGGTTSGLTLILNFPIFLQEMVMAVWLIVKGFDSSAITDVTTEITTSESQLSPA